MSMTTKAHDDVPVRTTVDIVEPQPLCRASLASALSVDPAFELRHVVAHPGELVEPPRLVVVGLLAGRPDTVAEVRRLCTSAEATLLLLPDLPELDWDTLRSLRDCATGGVSRHAELPSVSEALHAVAKGQSHWFLGMAVEADAPRSPAVGLTPREREVLDVLSTGCSDREIAAALSISVRTVWSHLERIRAKSGLRNRVELALLALRSRQVVSAAPNGGVGGSGAVGGVGSTTSGGSGAQGRSDWSGVA